MKFKKTVGSLPYKISWISDDNRCEIHLHKLATREYDWVYISIVINPHQGMGANINCARDGVSAFMVNELMVIAGRHQGATSIGPVEAQVKEFLGRFSAITPVDLSAFNRYKESQRRTV